MVQSIKIASVYKNICEVEYFFNAIFRENRFSRKIYCKMYLASTEAVNNAIFHGNKLDPQKTITISFLGKNDFFIVTVDDEGNGFDFKNVPDPRKTNNIRKESGRGIFIMKEYADKIIFSKNGASVKLIFNK